MQMWRDGVGDEESFEVWGWGARCTYYESTAALSIPAYLIARRRSWGESVGGREGAREAPCG